MGGIALAHTDQTPEQVNLGLNADHINCSVCDQPSKNPDIYSATLWGTESSRNFIVFKKKKKKKKEKKYVLLSMTAWL